MGVEALIPITLFMAITAVFVTYFYFGHKTKDGVRQTLQTALESGKDLPPDIMKKLAIGVRNRSADLRRGIIFAAIGLAAIGLGILLDEGDSFREIAGGALFPLFVGLGYLLVYKLNPDKED